MSRRWQLGTYLGLSNSSNEDMVASRLGKVVKSRSVVRVVEASRWNSDVALAVVGTPTLLNPIDPEADDGYLAVDESEQAHLELDADLIRQNEGEPIAESAATRAAHETYSAPGKIMARDVERYGYTEDCPRCLDIQRGNLRSFRNHTDLCKLRMYLAWKENDDPKYLKIRHLFESEVNEPDDSDVLVAAEFAYDHENLNAAPRSPPPTNPVSSVPAPQVPLPPATPSFDASLAADAGDDEFEPSGFVESEDGDDVADIFMDDPEDIEDKYVDYLVMSGANPTDARNLVRVVMGKPPTTLIEMYGRGSMNLEANNSRRHLGLSGIGALYFRTTKSDGTP